MSFSIVISPRPENPTPTIVFGFTGDDFSQAVYMTVPSDPLEVIEMANKIAAGFIEACAEAVKQSNA